MAATEHGRLTWAGLTPDEHAERVAARAGENAAKIPEEYRRGEQRCRLRVVNDDVDSEEQYVYEGSHFGDPVEAVELVRHDYPGEYEHGLYDVEPVYVRFSGDREQTVPFGEPLNGDRALYAVGYVREYRDHSSGHSSCAETVTLTAYVDRERAGRLLEETRAKDPGFDGYFLVPDRDGPEDEYEEPPDDDGDPLDDGTIGYDYYGPSWPTRDI